MHLYLVWFRLLANAFNMVIKFHSQVMKKGGGCQIIIFVHFRVREGYKCVCKFHVDPLRFWEVGELAPINTLVIGWLTKKREECCRGEKSTENLLWLLWSWQYGSCRHVSRGRFSWYRLQWLRINRKITVDILFNCLMENYQAIESLASATMAKIRNLHWLISNLHWLIWTHSLFFLDEVLGFIDGIKWSECTPSS